MVRRRATTQHGDRMREGAIWLDLADDHTWRAVKISREGWTVESNPPTLFRRYAQQLPLSESIHGRDPWKLLSIPESNIRRAAGD